MSGCGPDKGSQWPYVERGQAISRAKRRIARTSNPRYRNPALLLFGGRDAFGLLPSRTAKRPRRGLRRNNPEAEQRPLPNRKHTGRNGAAHPINVHPPHAKYSFYTTLRRKSTFAPVTGTATRACSLPHPTQLLNCLGNILRPIISCRKV